MNAQRGLCITAFLLLLTGLARAEINAVDSVEWATLDAEIIVRGKVMKSAEVKGEGTIVYRDVTVAVHEILKGKLGDDQVVIDVRIRTIRNVAPPEAGERSYLFFLVHGRAVDDRNLAGRWVPRDPNKFAISLDAPGKVFKADLTFAKTTDEILGIVRRRAREEFPAGLDHALFRVWREIPMGAEIYQSVFAGSSCFVIVPADWKASLEKMGARDVTMSAADAPDGWKRAAGGAGLRLAGRYPLPPRGEDVAPDAPVAVFVMPSAWEGESAFEGERLKGGNYSLPDAESAKDAAGARYIGQAYWLSAPWVRQHMFVTPSADWLTRAIEDRWSPGIVNAYVAGTGINSVAIGVGRGGRMFTANGWVDAHDFSGDPKHPFLHMDRRMIPQRELEAIWRTALTLDEKILVRRDDKRKFGDYMTLHIGFTDGRRTVIMWPLGEEPDDLKVRALVALLHKSHYGAW